MFSRVRGAPQDEHSKLDLARVLVVLPHSGQVTVNRCTCMASPCVVAISHSNEETVAEKGCFVKRNTIHLYVF